MKNFKKTGANIYFFQNTCFEKYVSVMSEPLNNFCTFANFFDNQNIIV